MRKLLRYSLGIVFLLVGVLLFSGGSSDVQAQEFVCPPEFGCAEIILAPDTLLGDFYINEQPVAFAQHRPILQVTPGQNVTVVIRNIQSPGEVGFNDLFVYQETTITVFVRAGQLRTFNARPRQQFIRGTLSHTCEPRNIIAGEEVSCQVLIDGSDRGVFPVNTAASFNLDPGDHVVHVQLLGASAALWEPNFLDQTANIRAGRTTNLRSRFNKRAHLIVNMNTAGVVGDFFINDVLIAAQVASIDLYVAANVRQNIAARNINPPPSGFRWTEATSAITLSAGQTRTVTLRLRQESLVSRQQAAALDSMQRTLDRGKLIWADIAEEWYAARDSPYFYCTGIPSALPALPNVNQAVLNENPAYQEAVNVLTNAINQTRSAIEILQNQCDSGLDWMQSDVFQAGLAATDNALNSFNDVQNRINALRNPPQ